MGFYVQLQWIGQELGKYEESAKQGLGGKDDPITTTMNQYNPAFLVANSYYQAEYNSAVHGWNKGQLLAGELGKATLGMAKTATKVVTGIITNVLTGLLGPVGTGIGVGIAFTANLTLESVDIDARGRGGVSLNQQKLMTSLASALATAMPGSFVLALAAQAALSVAQAGFQYDKHGNQVGGFKIDNAKGEQVAMDVAVSAALDGALNGVGDAGADGARVEGGLSKALKGDGFSKAAIGAIKDVIGTGTNTTVAYAKMQATGKAGDRAAYEALNNQGIGRLGSLVGSYLGQMGAEYVGERMGKSEWLRGKVADYQEQLAREANERDQQQREVDIVRGLAVRRDGAARPSAVGPAAATGMVRLPTVQEYMDAKFPDGYEKEALPGSLRVGTDVRLLITNLAREHHVAPEAMELMLLAANNAASVDKLQAMIDGRVQLQAVSGFGWTKGFQGKYYDAPAYSRAMNETLDGKTIVDMVTQDVLMKRNAGRILGKADAGDVVVQSEVLRRIEGVAKENGYGDSEGLYHALGRGDYAGGVGVYKALAKYYTGQILAAPSDSDGAPSIAGTRGLTHTEKMLARLTYGAKFDADAISLVMHNPSGGFTSGNNISIIENSFGQGGNLRTVADVTLLMHELGHAAQFQAEQSPAYMAEAASDYAKYGMDPRTSYAYRYDLQIRDRAYKPLLGSNQFSSLRPDGQAELAADMYFGSQGMPARVDYRILRLYRQDWAGRSYGR
jgi:hypothetical protein